MHIKSLPKPVTIIAAVLLASCSTTASPAPASSPVASPSSPAASAREQFQSTDRKEKAAAAKPAEASSPAPANASAAAAAANGVGPAAPGQVGITLGPPQQVFHLNQPDAFGMSDVPDQQPAILQQPDGSYLIFLNGRIDNSPAKDNAGNVAVFSTKDLVTYTPVFKNGALAAPVFGPLCENRKTCTNDAFDADYVGGNMVFRGQNGTDLLMIYNGVSNHFGGQVVHGPFFAEEALAKSTDGGAHWTRLGPIVQGTDPKPTPDQVTGAGGIPQPGGIIANGYIYLFYPYFPTKGSPDYGPEMIQAARAPVTQDGAPGTWTKYYNGSFSQPGLRPGLGSQVVPTGSCDRPAQPSIAFSTYVNAYVMTLLCKQGWFFSTSPDLINWTPPSQFFVEPNEEFVDGQPTDENVTLVTAGKPAGTIDQTGYVLYSNRPSWGHGAGEFWMRPFTFDRNGPAVQRVPSGEQPGQSRSL